MQTKNKIVYGFHHVAIRAYDFDASVRFYLALGMTEKIRWGEGDSRGIMLDTGDGNYIEIFAGGVENQAEGAWFHIALRTDDVDAAIEQAKSAGAVVTVEPKDIVIKAKMPVPVRLAFCKGPDGELIEFFQNSLT